MHTRVWRRFSKCPFPGFSPSFCSFEGSRANSKPAPNPGTHQTPVETLSDKFPHRGFCASRTPNLGPNSGKRILPEFWNPNSGVESFGSFFSSKRGPLKNSPSRNSPPKIHLPKLNPEIGPKNSHCTSAGPFG